MKVERTDMEKAGVEGKIRHLYETTNGRKGQTEELNNE